MTKKFIKKIGCIIIILGISTLYYWQQKPYNLSIAAIMKNEKPYLKEWIEYHLMQGIEHFYLCDNESTDGTKDYLKPYIDKGKITYIYMPGNNKQLECYEKIVEKYKDKTKWLAIIDLDEFLVPINAKNMQEFLKEFEDVSEVSLYWMNYGDNGIFSRENGLIIEDFTAHGKSLNHTVKSIVRPKDVIDFKSFGSNHYVKVRGKSVNENHQPITYMLGMNISAQKARINHYIIKSFQEFLYKKGRGHPEGTAIDYTYYFYHNENDIKDDTTMQKFLSKLKQRLRKSPLADVSLPKIELKAKTFNDFYFTPLEASQILRKEITQPMNLIEVGKAYKDDYPRY